MADNWGHVTACFWDIQTSGQATSACGTGRTTAEMQTAKTFLDAGWDFVCETANGTEDIWWILEGKGYPRLWWQYGRVFWPDPWDGAVEISRWPILRWTAGGAGFCHDVYLGDDEAAVADATSQTQGIYRGRQVPEMTTYDPGILEWARTYYWRIDEVNEADPNSPWKGSVWSFTTTHCVKAPYPADGASDVIHSPILSWVPVAPGVQYDVYLGEDENVVANATPESVGIYQGRQRSEMTTYEAGRLKLTRTYYWRVDEADPNSLWKGSVWSFTTGHCVVSAYPADGAIDVTHSPILSWVPVASGLQYDVYLGEDGNAVANATPESLAIYEGRQPSEMTTYELGRLKFSRTYYWRIDGVDEADPKSPWKGKVWSFTTTDCVISPCPVDGAIDVIHSPILSWVPVGSGLQYDVYLGEDENAVANATPEIVRIYWGRQASEMTTYKPGRLKSSVTYYWRIDGVDEADPNSPWKGKVWSFTAVEFLCVVEDFESYVQDFGAGEPLLVLTWISGLVDHRTGSIAGPFAERTIIHGGKQSMPFGYDNTGVTWKAWYSEAQRTWETPQDWTTNHTDTLTLYFQGKADNGREPLYVGIEDSAGQIAVVTHPDANAVLATQWQKWHIALAGVRAAGVDVAAVKKMVIGVGDRKNPQPGGTGRIYIDDIWLTYRNLVVGDFDGDGDTDWADFCIFGQRWLGTDSSFWCGAGGKDLTSDGFVDFEDLMVLADNWLRGFD